MIQLIALAGLTFIVGIFWLIIYAQSFDIELQDLDLDEDDV